MLDILNLPGLEVAPGWAVESEDGITITVSHRPMGRPGCPHCGSVAIAPNGTRATTYADTPMRGKPVIVQWQRQRFKCKEAACGKTCTDTHDGLHDDFLMTSRLYDWVGPRCLTHTFAAVALDVGLDERTVRRVFELLNRDAIRQERIAKRQPTIGYVMERSVPRYFTAKPNVYGIDITTMTRLVESGHIFTVPTGFAG